MTYISDDTVYCSFAIKVTVAYVINDVVSDSMVLSTGASVNSQSVISVYVPSVPFVPT